MFLCSKEPSHLDGSFEHPQHMFWLRNKKNIFWYALLNKGLTYKYTSIQLVSEIRASVNKRLANSTYCLFYTARQRYVRIHRYFGGIGIFSRSCEKKNEDSQTVYKLVTLLHTRS